MSAQVARGEHGMVASGHPLATDAAIAVLKSGGNATDAAVAAALVLTVVCPHACSLAGDMYMLFFNAKDGRVAGLNATGRAPAAATPAQFPEGVDRSGIRSATIPGLLAGLADALARHGSQPLAKLIEPATRLAADGFTVYPYLTKNIEERKGLLSLDPVASDLFMPGGQPLQPGAIFQQPDLATSLQLIAKQGAPAFYQGQIARHFVLASQMHSGLLCDADFAGHSSLWHEPISGPFYGHTVWTMPPNSFGPTLLLQLLRLQAGGIDGVDPDSDDFILRGFAARRAAYAAVAKLIADPQDTEAEARQLIAAAIAKGDLAPAPRAAIAEAQDRSTTNVVVIDRNGDAVSLIESISTPFGAGMVIEKTGIVLNNRMAGFSTDPASRNCVAPAKRPAHTLAPCLVTQGSALTMTIGTPGTVGQTCTLAQILARLLAHGQEPGRAVDAPRWSADFQGKLIIEDRAPADQLQRLAAEGARPMPAGWISFGSVKLAIQSQDGLVGVADGRRAAAVAGC